MTRAIAVWSILASLVAAPPTASQPLRPRPALDAVFQAFDRHSIVLLGEVHWNAQQHRFIQRLLHDPRLPLAINDVAVEFGNSLYQPLIDRYVAGETVPLDSLRLAWRNTTQVLAWDRPIYADIYAAVRAVNRKLPPAKRIRVVALDPPIEWRSVNEADQFPRLWGYRDPVWFATLDREVLSKGRKVLVISGALHILRRDPPDFQPRTFDRLGLGDAIAQRYPQAAYRIYPVIGHKASARVAPSWPRETLIDVKGTTIGSQSSQLLWPSSVTMFRKVNGKSEPFVLQEKDFPPIESLIDAMLYYGTDTTSTQLPVAQYRDCEYLAELRRRNQILLPVFGQEQRPLIDSLASRAVKSSRGIRAAPCAS